MVVFGIFFLSPFLVGGAAEYLCCRLPKKRWWRWVPLLVALTLAGALAWGRYYGWSDTAHAPIETILFFPGLPLLGALLGIIAGFLVWKKLWTPQVVKHHRAGEQWKRWK